MSARQRFVAGGKAPAQQLVDAAGNEPTGIMKPTTSAATEKLDSGSATALKDASNSPRPGKNMRDSKQINKSNNDTGMDSSAQTHSSNVVLSSAGVDKPLNISSLTRLRNKKTGHSPATPGQNKKHRNSVVDMVKENEPTPSNRSARHSPMSPSRIPRTSAHPSTYLFGSASAVLLADSESGSPTSRQNSLGTSINPAAHTQMNSQRYSRTPVIEGGISFTASGQALLNGSTPPAPHSYNEHLEPSRSEIFPMRSNTDDPTDAAHIRDSLSPPPPRRLFAEERTYDYKVPINLPDNIDQDDATLKHSHRALRRTTKRIGPHDTEDDTMHGRPDKRSRTDAHTNDQYIDLTLEHRTHPSRSSTPAYRYQTPHVDSFHPHEPQVTPLTPIEPQVPNPLQLGEDNEALYRLLRVDLEHYLSQNVERYEAEKRRWTSCSIEEWNAGANEMSAKFSRVVDFVKEHMTSKLAVYATLHEKVAQHKSVLGERQSTLKNKREKLVKDSGMVLGGRSMI